MARERLSRGDLLLFGALLSLAGLADSAYLTWLKLTGTTTSVCNINSFINCEVVQSSPYSSFLGIPTAALGLGGFLILVVLFALAFRGTERVGPWPADAWLLLFAILGALIGLGLTLLEVFVIQAICLFCIAGFALDLGILAIVLGLRRRAAQDR